MKRLCQFVTITALLTLGASSFAQQKPAPKSDPKRPSPQQNFQPQGRPNFLPPGSPGDRKGHHRIGSWLRQFQHVPPEQQERALEKDPKFQALPPDVQQRMRDNLRRFNALPPDERRRRLERMEHFREMTPEQRQRWWAFQREVRGLPEDRQKDVRHTFRALMEMQPEQRQEALASDRFKQEFSDQERDLITRMTEEAARHGAAQPPPRQDDNF
jgi:hypothetical protein